MSAALKTRVRTRNPEEILNRPRLVEAFEERDAEQAGTFLPEQGLITDVDRAIYALEGLDYDKIQRTKAEIIRLKQILSSYKAIQAIFQVNSNPRMNKINQKIEVLQDSIN
jgi:hypothetical protein